MRRKQRGSTKEILRGCWIWGCIEFDHIFRQFKFFISKNFIWGFEPVISVLDCKARGLGFKSWPGQKFSLRFLLHRGPFQLGYDHYTDRTPSVGRCDGEGKDWPHKLIC